VSLPARIPEAGAAPVSPVFFSEFTPGRRGEILDAALAVFAEKGYAGGTMRDIATRVGVTEPALYRHFASKQDLFGTLMTIAADRLRTEAFTLLDTIRPDAIRASLLAAIQDRRDALHRYAPLLRTMVVAASFDEESLGVLRAGVVFPIIGRVTKVASRVDAYYGIERSAAQRAEAMRAFMSMFVGTVVTSIALGDTPDAVVVDAMLRIMGWDRA